MEEVTARYRAEVRRGDRWWLVYVPEIDRTTQARNLREVEPMARDLIAVMTDVDPATIDLEVDLQLPEGAAAHWRKAADLHAEAGKLRSQAAGEAGAAARELRQLGLTVRDIGQLLQVSHQRAAQLLKQG